MIYVALLRGINVGGNNKIDMKSLKESFVKLDLQSVVTYINSGNVVFAEAKRSPQELEGIIRQAILEDFALDIPVLIHSLEDFERFMQVLPEHWKNDQEMKCDVLFLWKEIDKPETLKGLTIKPDIDHVLYVPGVILWSVDRKQVTRSGLMKIVGTDLYQKMTVRNVNTARKLFALMQKAISGR
jgi:uncharacterized protein (DUF1697 family)